MPGSRGFNPFRELGEFTSSLWHVRSNPLYIYARVSERRRAGGRLKRGLGELGLTLALALLISASLLYPLGLVLIRQWPLAVGQLGLAWRLMGVMMLGVLPLYFAWLLVGLYRSSTQALQLLAQHTGRDPVLNLSEELATTQLSGYDVLAAGMARLMPPLFWRVLAGIPVVFSLLMTTGWLNNLERVQGWAVATRLQWISYPEPAHFTELLGEAVAHAFHHSLLVALASLLAVLCLVMLCIVAGLGMRSRTAVTTFAFCLVLAQAAWLNHALQDLVDSLYIYEVYREQMMSPFSALSMLIVFGLYYLALIWAMHQPRRVVWVTALALPWLPGIVWFSWLSLQGRSFMVQYLTPELNWLGDLLAVFSVRAIPVPLEYWGEYLEYAEIQLGDLPRTVLTTILQLILLAILIRFARGAVLLKERGGAGASLKR